MGVEITRKYKTHKWAIFHFYTALRVYPQFTNIFTPSYPNITNITMSLVIHVLEDHIAWTIIPNWGLYMKYIIQSKVFRFINLILYSMSVISDFSE